MTRGANGRSLEGTLEAHVDKVYAVARELDALEARTAILEGAQRRAFQRVGLVRFNPFEDTGGNQSFAVALLDAVGDGFVLSSLHARQGTRVYAKTVAAGPRGGGPVQGGAGGPAARPRLVQGGATGVVTGKVTRPSGRLRDMPHSHPRPASRPPRRPG